MKEAAPLTGGPDHDWAIAMVAHHQVCWALKMSPSIPSWYACMC